MLSVGAIDFGLVVDATVIMVENIFRHLAEPPTALRQRTLQSARRASRLSGKLVEIFASASEVNTAIFFSAAIIIAGFVPLFTMSGVEGHIFAPMAKTYAYAIAGGLIATFTISPALSAILLPDRVSEVETLLVRGLHRVYRPVLEFALANRIVTLGGAAVLLGLAAIALPSLGLEFLPKLEEGNLWIRATLPPSISLEEANGYVNRMRRLIKSYPEVDHRRLAERSPGRRHRCHRLLQCRILRAVEAVRNLAQRRGQGEADRTGQRRAECAIPGR